MQAWKLKKNDRKKLIARPGVRKDLAKKKMILRHKNGSSNIDQDWFQITKTYFILAQTKGVYVREIVTGYNMKDNSE